jgi:hypothetical protein
VVARLEENYQQVIDGLAGYITVAVARGLFRPVNPQLAAWAIVGMLERADLDHLVDDLVRLELGGLLINGWEDHFSSGREQR